MKGAFIEAFADTAHIDPLDGAGSVPFDYAAVDDALSTAGRDMPLEQWEERTAGFRALAQFILGNRPVAENFDRLIGRRTLVTLWILNPALFDGRSLSDIARSIGVTPAALADISGDFSRMFGIRTRAQAQGAGKFKPKSLEDQGVP